MRTDSERAIEGLYSLGHWLLEQGRPQDAVHVFRAMVFSAPTDERSWLGLGESHHRLTEHATALRIFVLGEHAVPGTFRCTLARARLLREIDAGDQAEAAFEAASACAHTLGDDEVVQQIANERRGS
jgi:hypothetical protein